VADGKHTRKITWKEIAVLLPAGDRRLPHPQPPELPPAYATKLLASLPPHANFATFRPDAGRDSPSFAGGGRRIGAHSDRVPPVGPPDKGPSVTSV
jgi:hypothetical protein